MDKHKEKETLLRLKIEIGMSKLVKIPSKENITRRSDILLRLRQDFLKLKKHLDEEMTFDDKRKLLQYAFDGKDANGKRCGVYIRKADNGRWIYEINGLFHEKGIAKKINHVDIAPKIHADADEYVYEPLEDSGPSIESAKDVDILTDETNTSHMQVIRKYNKKQDMRGIYAPHHCCGYHK